MKKSSLLKVAILAWPLVFVSCKSKKVVTDDNPTPVPTSQTQFLNKVKDNVQTTKFITSKVKFTVEVGSQNISLTGNMKMKRDDVIRLQLMAFGFVEAARLEFTKDYVLIMDRINKQFLKAPYMSIDFLRNSGLNFYSLQALFWNELFQPNRVSVNEEDLLKYATTESGDDIVISLDDSRIDYSWLASRESGVIKMANILYKDRLNGNSQLNWDYVNFATLENSNVKFPDEMNVTLTTPKKEVKLRLKLNYIGNETEWNTRTEVSNKYREVTIDEILQRFMAL
ncbi:MAG: DUF4292 domain-containing protein [Prevotella sp.]|nr:DUF4292 domain-containing protein [Prevotella sp.]